MVTFLTAAQRYAAGAIQFCPEVKKAGQPCRDARHV